MSPEIADIMQIPIFLWEFAWLSLHIPSSPNVIKPYFLQKQFIAHMLHIIRCS